MVGEESFAIKGVQYYLLFSHSAMVKSSDLFPAIIGGDGLSRYHTDFHEIMVRDLKLLMIFTNHDHLPIC